MNYKQNEGVAVTQTNKHRPFAMTWRSEQPNMKTDEVCFKKAFLFAAESIIAVGPMTSPT
jgi:hypothetical protein